MGKKSKLFAVLMTLLLIVAAVGFVACDGGKVTKYTVAFQSNGGSQVASVTLAEGEVLNEPTAPTRDGYEFDGWYKDAALTERMTFPFTMGKESFNLYAKWKKGDYTITFDSNGGTEISAISSPAFDKVEEPDAPTKADRVFAGWFTDEECTVPFDFVMPNRDLTVYARWLKLEEKTAFEFNSGWISGDRTAYTLTEEDGVTTITALADKGTYSYVGIKIPYNVKNYGAFVFTFTGTADEEVLIKCQNGGVTTVETRVAMNGKENQTYVWTVKPENLTDGRAAMDFYLFLRPGLEGEGATIAIKSLKLYRVLGEDDPYQSALFFETNGGTAVSPIFAETGATITAPADEPVKAGYDFEAWYAGADLTTPYVFGTMPEGKTFVYAKYAPKNEVTLTFETNGGTAVEPLTLPATAPIDAQYIPTTTKDGVIFDAWYFEPTFETKFDFKFMPAESKTLYARWGVLEETSKIELSTEIASATGYTMTDNGDGTTTVSIAAGKSTYQMFTSYLELNAKDYTYFRITFTGTEGKKILFKTQNGGVKATEVKVDMTGEEQTYLWKVAPESLPDGTAGAMNFYMCLDPGTKHDVAPDPAISVTVTSIELLRLKTEGANDSYAVHFMADGGLVDDKAVPTAFYEAGETLALPVPEKVGHTFDGWYTDPELTEAFAETTMPERNIILYAKYTATAEPFALSKENWTVVDPESTSYAVTAVEEGAKVNFDHTNNGGWDNYNSGACYNVTDHPIENTKLTLSIDLVKANYASKETRPGIVIEVYLYKAEDNYTFNGNQFKTTAFPTEGGSVDIEIDLVNPKGANAAQKQYLSEMLEDGNFGIMVIIMCGFDKADYGNGNFIITEAVFS